VSRIGVISDIHGNLHALRAVLADIETVGVDGIVCLGDVVGYGPHPGECLELVQECCMGCVMGNHEEAVLNPEQGVFFNPQAQAALEFTVSRLEPHHLKIIEDMPCWANLESGTVCVHDAPVPVPCPGYVSSTEIAARVLVSMTDTRCLFGHTHVPAAFSIRKGAPESSARRLVPFADEPIRFRGDWNYLLNPGSVGQPRDDDWRASWGILDQGRRCFSIRRVAYEVGLVQSEIELAGLPAMLGSRLRIGA
jgi:predicted phosphodiesterase